MAKFAIMASELKSLRKSMEDRKLADLKKEIIEILKKQDEKDFKKAIDYFESQELHFTHLEKSLVSGKWVQKAGYGIGTVRIWKGKKYKKIAPGKWARVFDKEGRGTNIAIGKLIARVNKIDNAEDLLQFVMENKQRFIDEDGRELGILDKVRAAVDTRNEKLSGESSPYVFGVGENVNRAKNEMFSKKDKIKKEEADLHKVSRKLSQIPTTELKQEKARLERAVANKTRSKRDSLNNTIFRESNQEKLEAINKELEKRSPVKAEKNSLSDKDKKMMKDFDLSESDYLYLKDKVFNELNPDKDGIKTGVSIQGLAGELYEKDNRFKKLVDKIENQRPHSARFYGDFMYQLKKNEDITETEKKPAEKYDDDKAYEGKLATQKQVDEATAISNKYEVSRNEMLKKPITTIQKYANSTVEDFEGGIDKFIEYMAEGRSEGVSMDEVGKEFAKLINHNVARKIWDDYESGALIPDEKGILKPKESETEKTQNRSEAMKGNKNAYKGGHEDEPVHNKVSKNGIYYTFDGFAHGLNRSFRQAKDLPQNIKDNINNSVKRYLDYVDNYTDEGYKKVAEEMISNPEKFQHMSVEDFTKEYGYDKSDVSEIVNLKYKMEFAEKLRNFNLDDTMISKDAEQNFRDEIYPISLKQNIEEGFLPNQIAELEEKGKEKTPVAAKKVSAKVTTTTNPDKLKPIAKSESIGEGKVKIPYSKEIADEIKQLTNSVAEIKVSDTRYAMMNKVCYDKGNLVATDGKCMKIIKVGELSGIDNGTYVDIDNSKDGITITADKEFTKDHKFPQYERVLPQDNKEKIVLDNKALISKIKDLKKDGSISNKDSFVTFDIQGNDLMLDGVKVGDVSAANFEGEDSNYFNIDSNLLTKYLSGDYSELMSSKDNSKAMYLGNDSAINIIMPQTKYEYKYDSSGNQKREIRRKDYDSRRKDKEIADEAKSNKKAAQKMANQEYVDDVINGYKRTVPADFEEKSIKKIQDWDLGTLHNMYKIANADINHLMETKDLQSNSFMSFTNKEFGCSPRHVIGQNYAMKEHPAIVREIERLIKEKGGKIEKSLFDDFIVDVFAADDEEELEDELYEGETEYNDYSAEQPELFNSTAMKVREALDRIKNQVL